MTKDTKKPVYSLSDTDKQYGRWDADGTFHMPMFAVMRNGEPIFLDEDASIFSSSYEYHQAERIMKHLKAISDDAFTLE